jgi:hypothetical protein
MHFKGLPGVLGELTVRRIQNYQAKQIKAVSCPAPGKTGQRKAVSASCPPKHDKHYQRTISINLSRAISKHFNSIRSQLFCVHKNVRRHENKAKRAICYNAYLRSVLSRLTCKEIRNVFSMYSAATESEGGAKRL